MQNCFARACCWALVDFFETFFLGIVRTSPFSCQALSHVPFLCHTDDVHTRSTEETVAGGLALAWRAVPLFSHQHERLYASISQHAQGVIWRQGAAVFP